MLYTGYFSDYLKAWRVFARIESLYAVFRSSEIGISALAVWGNAVDAEDAFTFGIIPSESVKMV